MTSSRTDITAADGRGARNATIGDVARLAEVSTATVSRVLSGSRPVRQASAERVYAAAAQLDYHPNAAARGLSMGSMRHVGVLMPQLSNPYFAEIIERLSRRAAGAGYRLIISDGGGSADGEAPAAAALLQQTDGVILLAPRMPTEQLRSLARTGRPLSVVNRIEHGVEAATIVVDNFRSMTKLCGYLSSLGHRRIAYLSGPAGAWQDQERWRALQAAEDLGLNVQRLDGDGRIETATDVTDTIIASEVTAVVCFNDLSAIGVINQLHSHGVLCPDHISVTGFDGIAMASYLQPPLTTVAVDKIVVADHAWQALMDLIDGGSIEEPVHLPGELLVRSSTAQAR